MASGDNLTSANLSLAKNPRVGDTVATADSSATNSGTNVELSVDTVTINAVSGRKYRLTWVFQYACSVANDRAFFRIREGSGTGGNQLTVGQFVAPVANTALSGGPIIVDWTASSTGSQTFSGTIQRASGTGSVTRRAATSQPAYLTAEYVSG